MTNKKPATEILTAKRSLNVQLHLLEISLRNSHHLGWGEILNDAN